MKTFIKIFFFMAIISIDSEIVSAQKIISYSLGEGYKEFVALSKPDAIHLKIKGGNMNLSEIYEQQLKDPNSLVSQLTDRGAFAWGEYTYYILSLQKRIENKVLWIPQTNSRVVSAIAPDNSIDVEEWYREAKYIYKCLELYSDFIKQKNNIAYDENLEQKALDSAYEVITDSIVLDEKIELNKQLDKIKFSKILNIKKWNKLVEEYNSLKFEDDSRLINSEISKLKEIMQKEIKQLPVQNFVKNKTEIQLKYDKIIENKKKELSVKFEERKKQVIQNQKAREVELTELDGIIKKSEVKIKELESIIDELKNSRAADFPPKPLVNKQKYLQLNKLLEDDYAKKFSSIVY